MLTAALVALVVLVAALVITACAGLRMKHRDSREAFVQVGQAERHVAPMVAPELPLSLAIAKPRDVRMPSASAVAPATMASAPVTQTPDAAIVAVPAANALVGPIAIPSDAVDDATAVPLRTAMLRRSPLHGLSLAGFVPGWPAIGVIAALAVLSFLLHAFLQRRSRRRRHMSTRKTGATPNRADDRPKVETIAMSDVWAAPVPAAPPSATPAGVGELPRSVTVRPGNDAGLLYLSAESAAPIEGDSTLAKRADMPSVESDCVFRPVEAPVNAIASAQPICVFAAAHVAVEPASAKRDPVAMQDADPQASEALGTRAEAGDCSPCTSRAGAGAARASVAARSLERRPPDAGQR